MGSVKRGQLRRQWGPRALELHAEIKAVFEPKNLLNRAKRSKRTQPAPLNQPFDETSGDFGPVGERKAPNKGTIAVLVLALGIERLVTSLS